MFTIALIIFIVVGVVYRIPPHAMVFLGFDPASEDDMDDNGMSRYMDNNDEEGWE